MEAHSSLVNTLGFYAPDPGGSRSPNFVRAVRGDVIEVREIVSGKITELSRADFFTSQEMCSQTNELLATDTYTKRDMLGRIRAMQAAHDIYDRSMKDRAAREERARVEAAAAEEAARHLAASDEAAQAVAQEARAAREKAAASRQPAAPRENFELSLEAFLDASPSDAVSAPDLPLDTHSDKDAVSQLSVGGVPHPGPMVQVGDFDMAELMLDPSFMTLTSLGAPSSSDELARERVEALQRDDDVSTVQLQMDVPSLKSKSKEASAA